MMALSMILFWLVFTSLPLLIFRCCAFLLFSYFFCLSLSQKGYVDESEAWDKKLGKIFGLGQKKDAKEGAAPATSKMSNKKPAAKKPAASSKVTQAKAEGKPKAKKGWW